MGRIESVTPTDWEMYLLHILWQHGQSSVDEIREILRDRGIKRSDSALRTILRIMDTKGWVKAAVINRTRHYTANLEQTSVEQRCFQHMIDTVFQGNHEDFVLRVLEESKITNDVIKKMKEKINEHKKKE